MNVYMHSNVSTGDGNEIDGVSHNNNTEMKCANDRKIQLVWRNIFLISIFHLGGIYGLYLLLTSAKLYTILFSKIHSINNAHSIQKRKKKQRKKFNDFEFLCLQRLQLVLEQDLELQPVLIAFGHTVHTKQNHHCKSS